MHTHTHAWRYLRADDHQRRCVRCLCGAVITERELYEQDPANGRYRLDYGPAMRERLHPELIQQRLAAFRRTIPLATAVSMLLGTPISDRDASRAGLAVMQPQHHVSVR